MSNYTEPTTPSSIPECKWEVTYQKPDGSWRWYITPVMPFDDACRAALATIGHGGTGDRLVRVAIYMGKLP